MREIPQAAIDIIKSFEGCQLHDYKDVAGITTVGIGHRVLSGEDFTGGITQQQAEDMLRSDLTNAANAIKRFVTRALSDDQYSALLSFTFNLGGGTLEHSTLLKVCNSGKDDDMSPEFMKWTFAGGVKSSGLIRRRAAEAKLYMSDGRA